MLSADSDTSHKIEFLQFQIKFGSWLESVVMVLFAFSPYFSPISSPGRGSNHKKLGYNKFTYFLSVAFFLQKNLSCTLSESQTGKGNHFYQLQPKLSCRRNIKLFIFTTKKRRFSREIKDRYRQKFVILVSSNILCIATICSIFSIVHTFPKHYIPPHSQKFPFLPGRERGCYVVR